MPLQGLMTTPTGAAVQQWLWVPCLVCLVLWGMAGELQLLLVPAPSLVWLVSVTLACLVWLVSVPLP